MNNLEIIKKFLIFESEDDFYFLQIIKRKKEHPEMPKSVKVVHTFYIYSLAKLEELMDEIIYLCDYHNARAYINLNKRSFEQLAYQTLKQVTDCIMNKEFRYIRKSYNTCCGRFNNEKNKKWIVDIDKTNILIYEDQRQILINTIRNCEPNRRQDKVLEIIPTKNGCHLITSPFNTEEFKKFYPDIDIHKDNPTLLYFK